LNQSQDTNGNNRKHTCKNLHRRALLAVKNSSERKKHLQIPQLSQSWIRWWTVHAPMAKHVWGQSYKSFGCTDLKTKTKTSSFTILISHIIIPISLTKSFTSLLSWISYIIYLRHRHLNIWRPVSWVQFVYYLFSVH